MRSIDLTDLTYGYLDLIDLVTREGEDVAPRGVKTKELRNVQINVASNVTVAAGMGRKLSMKILAAEMAQWISGTSDLKQLASVSRGKFLDYSDDGDRLYGAYGPRSWAGMRRAVASLAEDPDSRQAVVSIWRDNEAVKTRDLPCTLSWGFLIRDGMLEMTTTMRSNDVWTGVAYDVPIMCRIGDLIAWALGVPFNRYTHQAMSLHLYESDMEAASKLTDPASYLKGQPPMLSDGLDEYLAEFEPELSSTAEARWRAATELALTAMRGSGPTWDSPREQPLPAGFEWLEHQLMGTDKHPFFCSDCRYWLPQPELNCPRNGA